MDRNEAIKHLKVVLKTCDVQDEEAVEMAIKALEKQQKFNSNEFFEWLNNFDLEVDVGIYGVPAKLNLRHNIWYGKKKEFRSHLGWLSAELNEKIDAKMPLGKFLKRILEELPEPYKEEQPNDDELPSVQPDDDRLERCRFEYVNACKILAHRTPDTRKKDIDDAYAVVRALNPIFGEEGF